MVTSPSEWSHPDWSHSPAVSRALRIRFPPAAVNIPSLLSSRIMYWTYHVINFVNKLVLLFSKEKILITENVELLKTVLASQLEISAGLLAV